MSEFADGGYYRSVDEEAARKAKVQADLARKEEHYLFGTHYQFKWRFPFVFKTIGHPDIQPVPLWDEKDLV